MTNQASEERIRGKLLSAYLDGKFSIEEISKLTDKQAESVDRVIDRAIKLIRTEKLKLLAEVRERVVQGLPDTAFHGTSTRVKENIRDGGYHDGVLDSRLAAEETLAKLEAEL